ncbi:MAG: hypothetical protein QOI99_2175, partial [Actinomycetota bacterium]|nr:hypothetical protein [Actinomycetota bacterium]
MTRQAAPPAQRWLLLFVVLVTAPWFGHGVAVAAPAVGVTPPSGGPGTTVTLTVTDLLDACLVLFDDELVTTAVGCNDATLSFTVPAAAPEGDHTIRVVGQAGEASTETVGTFRVTGALAPAPAPTVAGGSTGGPAGSAGSAGTTAVGGSTSGGATVPGTGPAASAACPPDQVGLARFGLKPSRGPAGAAVSVTTAWGATGTCTTVRPLLVLFDGQPVAARPPDAGTSGSFSIEVPAGATVGPHRVSLVAADDESVELSSFRFQVRRAGPSRLPLVVGIAAGAVLLVVVVLVVTRRLRRRWDRRDHVPGPVGEDDDLWLGTVEVPDLAAAMPPAADAGTAVVMAADEDPTMPVVPLVVTSGRNGSFYLLERQNPHAPRAGNGRRGWYRTERTTPVRGIVVGTVDPHTGGSAASEMATGGTPGSAHVVVDVDGVLDLLPDDIVPMHRPDLDDAVLVVLLAGYGIAGSTDEVILGHATVWLTAKARDHRIPLRPVSAEEFRAGASGLLTDEAAIPWHRMVKLLQPPPARAVGGPDPDSGMAKGATGEDAAATPRQPSPPGAATSDSPVTSPTPVEVSPAPDAEPPPPDTPPDGPAVPYAPPLPDTPTLSDAAPTDAPAPPDTAPESGLTGPPESDLAARSESDLAARP